MGMLGLPMLLAPIMGPTLGGYLVEYASWRTIFLINLPIGLINLVLAIWLLKETTRRPEVRLDVPGFVLALFAFPPILLALSAGEERGWTSPLVLILLLVGSVSLIAFVQVELRQREPLLQLRLFEKPTFRLGMMLNFVTQFSLFGMQFVLPLMLQQVHRLGAAATGLLLFPSGIVTFLAMNFSGRIYNRVGPRPLAISGLLILLFTTAALSRTTPGTSLTLIGALASLRGLAMGLCNMPVQTAAFNTVARDQMTRATAISNVLFRIYGAISTAALTTILLVSLRFNGAPEGSTVTDLNTPVAFLSPAFGTAFMVMAGMAVVGIVLALFLRDEVLDNLRNKTVPPEAKPLRLEPAD